MKLKKVRKTALVIGVIFGFMFSLLIFNFHAPVASAAEPIELSMAPTAAPPPPQLGLVRAIDEQMKFLEKKSNGRIKITCYWGSSLADAKDLVKATQTGICDLAVLTASYEPGKLPLSNVSYMPGIGTNMWTRIKAFWDLMNQDPLLSELTQYDLRPLSVVIIPEVNLLSRKPMRTLAEIKGKKIRAGGLQADQILALGGVPIAMSPQEEYDALKKGLTDASTAPPMAISDFKFYEAAKYLTLFKFGCRLQTMVIGDRALKKIPADLQKIFWDSADDLLKIAYEVDTADHEKIMNRLKENDVVIFEPSDADAAALMDIQAELCEKWAAEMEDKGHPGKKILADYRALVDKYEKINPYK